MVTYKSVGNRPSYLVSNDNLSKYFDNRVDTQDAKEIQQIIKLGLSITSRHLNFTTDNNSIDPNKLIITKKAHCVGYASFFVTACNYLLQKYKLDIKWIAKAHIGQLYFLGFNVHDYYDTPFFRDHDFVTIVNKETGETYSVDPTVNDYFGIDFITNIKTTE